jgi:hypothetical protein
MGDLLPLTPSGEPPPRANSRRRRVPPALVRRRGAASLCGMGLSTFDRADASGLVPAGRKVGGCKLWCVAELRAWAAHGCRPRAEWSALWQSILTARRTGKAR